MLRRSRKLFIIVLFLGLLLSSLSACSRKDLSSGYSYTKKYKNKALRFGHIKRLGFTFEFEENSFDSNARLMIDVLSDEASKNLEDDAFEFYLNPIELNYGEEANLRLNKPATLNIKVPKEYYGTEFDASEMFFANYYDGNWEYYLPEYFDLTDKVATIDVSHFSFWGFGKPNEET